MREKTYSLDAAAHRLNIGRNRLIERLRELGMLTADNLPSAKERRGPYLRLRSRSYRHPVKGHTPYGRTEITERGLAHIAQLLRQPAGKDVSATPNGAAPRQHNESTAMQQSQPTRTLPPLGTLHDVGELIVVTMDGERVHHRAALVVVFEDAKQLQQAIDAHRCTYQFRRDIPEAQLHPELTAKQA